MVDFSRINLSRNIHKLALAALLLVLQGAISPTVAGSGKPSRVVSINLCTDQLLLLLADRDRIASVTYLATDHVISYFANRAIGIRQNHGLAEEILPLKPDLILAGSFTSRPTTSLLKKLGYRVVEFKMADGFETVRQNLKRAGQVLAEENKATRLITAFDKALSRFSPSGHLISAIILQPSAAGAGKVSLLDDILRTAGLTRISPSHGIMGIGSLTLDQIIAAQPELIISDVEPRWPSLGHLAMRHPAYHAIRNKQGRFPGRARLPANLWNCGGPQVAIAVSILAGARANILERRANH